MAPGQIITLFVAGVGAGLKQAAVAGRGDLPTTLAGISATACCNRPRFAVPILRVTPLGMCDCGVTSAITVQILYELQIASTNRRVGLQAIAVFVTENGVAGASRIHKVRCPINCMSSPIATRFWSILVLPAAGARGKSRTPMARL